MNNLFLTSQTNGYTHTQGGGVYKLEFLHLKFCTKFLCAICSVFLRICAGVL